MTKRYPKAVGGTDTKDFPRGKPSGIAAAMQIVAPLESATDISQQFGADKQNPPRGSKPPSRGPHRPR
jgi:hypothetical protein